MSNLCSRKSYEIIWDKIISKQIEKYKSECIQIYIDDNAKEIVWNNYENFNAICKHRYMKNPEGLLDRHKVCACMIYSIVKSSVLSQVVPKEKTLLRFSTINEDLAIVTGLSLLRAFIESNIREKEDEEVKTKLLAIFENGLVYPPSNHGNYRDNFLAELHYTKIEGNYNILSLAHSLFLLETFTRFSNTAL